MVKFIKKAKVPQMVVSNKQTPAHRDVCREKVHRTVGTTKPQRTWEEQAPWTFSMCTNSQIFSGPTELSYFQNILS